MPSLRGRAYGWAHQRTRASLLPYAIGKPCPMCGEPMTDAKTLDLDHSVPLARGGRHGDRIVHATCNRRAGALLGAELRKDLHTSRDW